MTNPRRLPHGYTNESWADEASVWKRYVGFEGAARMRRELDAIEAAEHAVPVPQVMSVDLEDRVVRFARVFGGPGQELLDSGHAEDVMFATGRTLATLQRSVSAEMTPGDYGPQTLLLLPDASQVVLVADWESSEVDGASVADLAWAEWIVRTHHPDQVTSVVELFAGYGVRPPWHERHAAMLQKCTWFILRAQRAGRPTAQHMWDQRRAVTSGWVDAPGA